jgi:hypothetical protein
MLSQFVLSAKVSARRIYLTLRNSILNLIDLNLTESFDLEQVATSSGVDRLPKVLAWGRWVGG